jgi:hypothetical protein
MVRHYADLKKQLRDLEKQKLNAVDELVKKHLLEMSIENPKKLHNYCLFHDDKSIGGDFPDRELGDYSINDKNKYGQHMFLDIITKIQQEPQPFNFLYWMDYYEYTILNGGVHVNQDDKKWIDYAGKWDRGAERFEEGYLQKFFKSNYVDPRTYE